MGKIMLFFFFFITTSSLFSGSSHTTVRVFDGSRPTMPLSLNSCITTTGSPTAPPLWFHTVFWEAERSDSPHIIILIILVQPIMTAVKAAELVFWSKPPASEPEEQQQMRCYILIHMLALIHSIITSYFLSYPWCTEYSMPKVSGELL